MIGGLKSEAALFQTYRTYSISFNLSNVVNFLWSLILKDCIDVQENKKKVVVLCSRPFIKRETRHFHVVVMQ